MGILTNNNNRTEHRHGQRPNNRNDRTLDEIENAEGDVIDTNEGDPTSPGLEENWD